MKRHIITTLLLLLATAFITVVYFKNLNPPGTRTSKVMNNIPDNAAFILEFNNVKTSLFHFIHQKQMTLTFCSPHHQPMD
jgi:hypothetical protein